MQHEEWQVVDTVAGDMQAEILKGLLEAQEVPVFLSQEGAGHSVYALTVGRLGEVDILVPTSFVARAEQILEDYRSGKFAATEDDAPDAS